jgi:purine-nucleoside phosphorylase
MTELRKQIDETVSSVRSKTASEPPIGIILGTGLGKLAEEIDKDQVISYRDIPHFPLSTVEFHAGNLIFGRLGEKEVVAMQGRFHYYEGYTMQQITYPVRVMKALGVKTLMVSNACGGLNTSFRAGDIMVITDHINLLGDNPLIGPNDDELGPRFPDMSEPYSREYMELVEQIASEEKIKLHKGVYAAVSGPNLETRAEYRMLQTIGADVIGMSTIPEVIVAVHSGLKVLGMSVITDECFPDTLKPADIKEILRHAHEAEPNLTRIMKRFVEKI